MVSVRVSTCMAAGGLLVFFLATLAFERSRAGQEVLDVGAGTGKPYGMSFPIVTIRDFVIVDAIDGLRSSVKMVGYFVHRRLTRAWSCISLDMALDLRCC